MRTSLGLGWWAARAPTWQRCAPSFRRGALSSRSAAALLLVLLHQCMLASLRCTAAAPDKTSNTGLHQLSTSLFIAALSRANLSHMHPTRRVQAPASIALPFGTFERVLGADCNRAVAAAVAAEERSAVSEMEGWGQVTNNAMHMPHTDGPAARRSNMHVPDWGPNRACPIGGRTEPAFTVLCDLRLTAQPSMCLNCQPPSFSSPLCHGRLAPLLALRCPPRWPPCAPPFQASHLHMASWGGGRPALLACCVQQHSSA